MTAPKTRATIMAAAIGSAVTASAQAQEAQAEHIIRDSDFQDCVRAVVLQNYPDAKGGFVAAADRAGAYSKFGDWLHFRERGLTSVTSVTVSRDFYDAHQLRVDVQNRSGLIVLPSSLAPYAVMELLETRTNSDSDPRKPDYTMRDDDERMALRNSQNRVIADILKCAPH